MSLFDVRISKVHPAMVSDPLLDASLDAELAHVAALCRKSK